MCDEWCECMCDVCLVCMSVCVAWCCVCGCGVYAW